MKQVLSIKKYRDTNGDEKSIFREVGVVRTNSKGTEFLDLHMFPGVTFIIKEKEQKPDLT